MTTPIAQGPVDVNVRPLSVGQKVRHNYKHGHGYGVIVERRGDGSERLAYDVQWDSGVEVMPYTHNMNHQEIVAT